MLILLFNFFANTAMKNAANLSLFIDSIIYWTIGKLFDVYYILASTSIIKSDMYTEIANKLLVVVGIVMLFYVAYALLKALVNPDELKNNSKLVTNTVISLVLINIVPLLFNYAFTLQNIIIEDSVVDRLIFGNPVDNVANIGRKTAVEFLSAFLYMPDEDNSDPPKEITFKVGKDNNGNEIDSDWSGIKNCIVDRGETDSRCKEVSFLDITALSDKLVDGYGSYTPIISTICGCILAYMILSFCLDMGVRVFKLAFYQIISPIPILFRIIPEKKSVFDNWVKATVATYLEVFIRLAVMYILTYFCSIIFQEINIQKIGAFPLIILVLGLFAFAKQAPKLISDVIGVNSGNIKLGLRGKIFDDTGFSRSRVMGFITGGLGGMATSLANGAGASGFVTGASNGWRGRGTQFNRQRQEVYQAYNLRGRASLFGGRSYVDKVTENAKRNTKKKYTESQRKEMAKFESSQEFMDLVRNFANNQAVTNQELLKTSQDIYDKAKAAFDANQHIRTNFEKSSEYSAILASVSNRAKTDAEAEMQSRVKNDKYKKIYTSTKEGKRKYQEDSQKVFSQFQRKYVNDYLQDSKEKGTISPAASQYLESIQNFSTINNQFQTADKDLKNVKASIESNAIEEARNYVLKNAQTGDAKKYKATTQYVKERDAEEAARKWRQAHIGDEDFIRQVAISEEAGRRLNSGPGGGPKPGGMPGGPQGGPGGPGGPAGGGGPAPK